MEKSYKLPAITWLKVTDYLHGWLQYELGGGAMVKGLKVICVQHLPGARHVLKMETVDDVTVAPGETGISMSDTRKNCIEYGLKLDPDAVEKLYGMTKERLKMYVPIECPKLCLTKNGVLRPWTLDVCFSQKQGTALHRLLRQEFWKAVEKFNEEFARRMDGMKYPAVEMIEEFCMETGTSDIHVDALRREWQRRVKRSKETANVSCSSL